MVVSIISTKKVNRVCLILLLKDWKNLYWIFSSYECLLARYSLSNSNRVTRGEFDEMESKVSWESLLFLEGSLFLFIVFYNHWFYNHWFIVFYKHHGHGRFPVNLLHIFRTPFPRNTSEERLLKLPCHSPNSTLIFVLSSIFFLQFITFFRPNPCSLFLWFGEDFV